MKLFAIIGALALILGTPEVKAAPLAPQGLFKRCFSQVTGVVPSYEISGRLKTKFLTLADDNARRAYAISLCTEILNNTKIKSDGTLDVPATTSFFTSAEQTDLFLKTYLNFERLHAGWFSKSSYVMRDDGEYTKFTMDYEAPALYWNAAMFIPGQTASSVVTTSNFYRPLRQAPSPYASSMAYFKNGFATPDYIAAIFAVGASNTITFLGTSAQENTRANLVRRVGTTIGLETVDPSTPYSSFPTLANTDATNSGIYLGATSQFTTQAATAYMLKTAGAGVLGSPPYMMMNLSTYISSQDGGLKAARDWSTSVMADVMCKQTPTLRYADGAAAIQPNVALTSPPFRGQASCMACHASLDPLAYTIRNFHLNGLRVIADYRSGGSGIQEITGTNFTDYVVKWPSDGTIVSHLVDKDTSFHLHEPTGALLYRSFDGTKVNIPVTHGLADVGPAIASTRDFYACTVGRYYKYITGREVNLNDPVISGITFDTTQSDERAWVIRTADSFKSGPQNLKSLWATIFASSWYQDTGYEGAK